MIGISLVMNVGLAVKLLVVQILQKTISVLYMINDHFYVTQRKCLMQYIVKQ